MPFFLQDVLVCFCKACWFRSGEESPRSLRVLSVLHSRLFATFPLCLGSCLKQAGKVCGGREGQPKQALKADGGGEAAVRHATDGPFDLVETVSHPRQHLGRENGFEAEGGRALCQQDVI